MHSSIVLASAYHAPRDFRLVQLLDSAKIKRSKGALSSPMESVQFALGIMTWLALFVSSLSLAALLTISTLTALLATVHM